MIETTESKFKQLERANLRTRLLLIAVLALGVAGWLFPLTSRDQIVEAQQFIVRDAKGDKRGALAVTADGPVLEFYDSNHTLRLVLSLLNNMPNLVMKDASGTGVLALADVPTGPGLMLYDRNGEPRAQLDVGREGPRLYLEDEKGFATTVGNYVSNDPEQSRKLTAASVILSNKELGVIWHAP